jgi:hypothetical protein
MGMGTDERGQACLARRAVEILEDQFGKWPLKAAASAIGVHPDTWKNWRDGTSKPNTEHLSRLFRRFGPKFIAFVTAPFEAAHLDLKAARIETEIQKLEAELEACKGLRAVAGGASHEDRALVEADRGSARKVTIGRGQR